MWLSRLGCQKENGRDFAPVRQIGKSVARGGKLLPLWVASRVDGYTREHKRDDDQQRCDDDLHSYTPLNDCSCFSRRLGGSILLRFSWRLFRQAFA